jgi:two-component system nitrogen regulation sensor histidine kinase GlnL
MLARTDLHEKEPYRQLAAAIPLPLLVVGPQDEIVFANPACERFFGTATGILSGLTLPDVIARDAPLFFVIAQARVREAVVEACDVLIMTRRGGDRLVDIVASPYAGVSAAVVVTLHEREFAERMHRQQLVHDGLRSLNGMAAILAHEIKNPLLGIRGAAQLLEENLGEDERGLTQLICAESDRIRALIDSMEAFGGVRPAEFAPVNIHEVLDRARGIAQAGFARRAKFSDAFDPSLPLVCGDRDRLIQVFVNLLRNASDALPQTGGEICLATAFRAGVSLESDGARRALPLEVTVRDNGAGVPSDLLLHIFDPFVTTKPRGAGLGLALVGKIVGEHGGIIECDSAFGCTEFRVLLPVIDEKKP